MAVVKCEICEIKTGHESGKKRIFMAQFPLEEDRCKQWVKITGKEDLVYVPIEKLHQIKFICGKHFRPKDFKKKKTQLKKNAVPCLEISAKPLSDEILSDFPIHLTKKAVDDQNLPFPTTMPLCSKGFSRNILKEHNYCKDIHTELSTFTQSSLLPSQKNISDVKRKRTCSPEPSTSRQNYLLPIDKTVPDNLKIGSFSPKLSTSTQSHILPSQKSISDVKRKTTCSLEPSTSRQNFVLPIDETAPDNLKIGSFSPKLSTSTQSHILPSQKSTSDVKRKRTCSPKPSTSRQNYVLPIDETAPDNFKIGSFSPKNLKSTQKDVDSPRKKKLRKKIKEQKIKIKTLQKHIKEMGKVNSPILKSFISASIKNNNRKPQGKRWTQLNKSIAIAIYKKSPKAYRYLKQLLPLPSVRTLQTILQNIQMDPGVYPDVISYLKKEGEKMSENNKLCVVMFDEIVLKKRLIYNTKSDIIEGYVDLGEGEGRSEEVADHALVFLLQGIHKKFKQPIAHYFVKGTISSQKLAVIIKNVLKAIRDAGFTILATICDQGPTNVGAINLLKRLCGNPENSNYYLVNNQKVFIIYDVPHLFKSIRNNFLNSGTLVLGNKTAKWSHLVELEAKNRSTLHFSKITKLHIAPKFRSKMKVKLAAQILSNTVSALLKLLSQISDNQEMLETAEIIEELDRLFDCTNGPSSRHDVKKQIRENVYKNSFHHRLWIKYKEKLRTLKFLKSDSILRLRNVRCINGYIITISSLQDIWEYVEKKQFKYLNLRQLNQDSLENLFGIIRQHSPTNNNPTCHHFQTALKSSVLTRLSLPRGIGTNCESDDSEILFDFHDIVFGKKNTQKNKFNTHGNESLFSTNEDHTACNSTSNEYMPLLHLEDIDLCDETQSDKQLEEVFKIFENQPTVYVSGYLAKAILKGVKCQECHQTIAISEPEPSSLYDYIALREWWTDKSSLTYPTLHLCNTVDLATKIFECEVRPQLFRKNIGIYSVTIMMTLCDMSWMCKDHKSFMSEILLRRLSNLLIRNDCNKINRTFAITEETSADLSKRAQQQAIAK